MCAPAPRELGASLSVPLTQRLVRMRASAFPRRLQLPWLPLVFVNFLQRLLKLETSAAGLRAQLDTRAPAIVTWAEAALRSLAGC